jgi:hypothetical protein
MSNAPSQPPRCLRCPNPRVPRYAPFCSGRCKDADLGAWLGEEYWIPADEDEAETAEVPPPASTEG